MIDQFRDDTVSEIVSHSSYCDEPRPFYRGGHGLSATRMEERLTFSGHAVAEPKPVAKRTELLSHAGSAISGSEGAREKRIAGSITGPRLRSRSSEI